MRKLLIMIVDDDPDLRALLRLQLESLDCEIMEARDGAEALEAILVEAPDLVILDVMMPNLTGWEILRYLRTRPEYEQIGVIMLTGIGERLNALSSPMYGADAYLDKPFKVQALFDSLERVLEARQPGRVLERLEG